MGSSQPRDGNWVSYIVCGLLITSRFFTNWATPKVCWNSCPLSQWCFLTIFTSIRVFSKESAVRIKWSKYWRFSFSISPSNNYSDLISFRIDWFDLPAVQGTLKSLLQHHNSKASILWPSDFFMVWLSHPCISTIKNHSFDYIYICQQSDVSAF